MNDHRTQLDQQGGVAVIAVDIKAYDGEEETKYEFLRRDSCI